MSKTPVTDRYAASNPTATLAVVCLALFMLLLDSTIVGVALPNIQQSLGASLSDLQWVVDGYTLPLASLLLTAAVFGDRIGRKRLFLAGLAIFTTASLGCALSEGMLQLNLMRAVQGTGAALMMGVSVPLVSAVFPDPIRKARAIGALAAVMGLATAAGPLVGGILVNSLGWDSIFLVNVPIGLLSLCVAIFYIGESRSAATTTIDWIGTVLVTAGLFACVLAVIEGNSRGWTSAFICGLFLFGAIVLAGFVWWELRTRHPMVDLRLVARPEFATLSIAGFVAFAAVAAAANFLALYFMNTLQFTALRTGICFLALSAAAMLVSPIVSIVQRRLPASIWLIVGLSFVSAGAYLSTNIQAADIWTHYRPGLILFGAAMGIVLPVTSQVALAHSSEDTAGMATGVVSSMRQLGTVVGIAALGALFTRAATASADANLPSSAQIAAGGPALPSTARDQVVDALGSGAGLRVATELPESMRIFESNVESIARVASDAGINAIFDASAILGVIGLISLITMAVIERIATPRASRTQEYPVSR
ncbi:MFS transporter [Nocardia brasiliensis]|uniref:Tetracenomycin C resistance and export protein n=1 Tax=Nocardia brasiliensis (strain ATCC 700358 / HUJEG-1) TaxID=1133849 RepID=K0F0K8_NOCB7|nr:MFS transporter [Nocardia brasiliensis]AFU02934.1 tetracenomycin C resistance and export protein [Nocardia brasiliensis ATCC 700358]OCF86008.1 hypothetical protein AW168_33130 [Nocardia brasiliensis]